MDTLPDAKAFRSVAANEAVTRLGLLKVEAVPTIEKLLLRTGEAHPRGVCSSYRSEGRQLSDEEKSKLRIRKNEHMSQGAFDEITSDGMSSPIRAHELTLLRAAFAVFRHNKALSAQRIISDHPRTPLSVEYDVVHPDACADCLMRHGQPVPSDWGLFPSNECTCVTAPYGLKLHIDFVAE